MFKTIHLRFEQQVALSVGVLCLVLIGASTGGAAWIAKRDAVQRISQETAALAGTMASALDSTMFERFREIQLIAGLEPLKSVWRSDPVKVRNVLNTLQTSLPTYAWIGFAAPDGTVRASTKGILEGASVAARPWFKTGLIGPALSDVHEALLLSKALDAPPQAEPFRFVDVAMPVYDPSKALVGVLGAHLSWRWADEVRKQLLAHRDAPTTIDIWILSSEGKVLLGPKLNDAPFDPDELTMMKAAHRGVFEDESPVGGILTGFAATEGFQTYPGLGWIVVTRIPTRVAFASMDHAMHAVLLLSSVISLVGIFLAWLLARRMAGPVRRLTVAAHQIGRDPATTMLPWLGGSQEFIELSLSLRSLLRRLGVAERERSHAEERATDRSRVFQQTIDSLREEADRDPLTGLLNRRAFLTFAADIIPYYRRYRRTVAILMIDIDFFKAVNDTHGHAGGDTVLCEVADALSFCVRATDKVSRFGGEEFVVLLREVDAAEANVVATKLRAAIENLSVRHGPDVIRVTTSIGAAVVSDADADILALIERADLALYAAKSEGRNCVRFQGAIDESGLSDAA
ncbi:sensor domain-containing diguanylate cyclase [Beijerinckia sp. L45]|uniref:sensor domain-containing diguanylate cyclase n=1 Tax=Beijerinckia sp. L45 TaxID=1641855 RepID=UPI00131C6765|nr:sensor domain-containing diguanylate cyclase [Beijerinckia sp. L45]